eukprot:TRINITY_DN6034_c0_g1_i10.p1 TRINITY_DN6034_c0_g1~~TRINITY_DN6034_c0_g1_i10.p1  ORF type:complete len:203 (+),score=76.75 TRINITY_DN6034_c0_g1_i10:666-1274(+)
MRETDLSFALFARIQEKSEELSEHLKQLPDNEKPPKKESNNLCLLMGAYMNESMAELRKTTELELLCRVYKAKIEMISGNFPAATKTLKGSQKALKQLLKDTEVLPQSMLGHIQSHYLALIRSLKCELAAAQGNFLRASSLITKNKEGLGVHPSQSKQGSKDTGNGFTHPIQQFNTLGVLSLRQKKYSYALLYFQHVSEDVT